MVTAYSNFFGVCVWIFGLSPLVPVYFIFSIKRFHHFSTYSFGVPVVAVNIYSVYSFIVDGFHCLCISCSWRRRVVVITTAKLHSTKPELRFCAGSNPAHGVSEFCDVEDLWEWSWLEIRLNAFRWSTIPQKQFIIIIIIIMHL